MGIWRLSLGWISSHNCVKRTWGGCYQPGIDQPVGGGGAAECGAAGFNFLKTPEAAWPGGGDARGPLIGKADNRLWEGGLEEDDEGD